MKMALWLLHGLSQAFFLCDFVSVFFLESSDVLIKILYPFLSNLCFCFLFLKTVYNRGLGLHSVLLSLLKVWCDPGNLVLVLGSQSQEEEYFITQLEAQGINPLPKVINNESNANDR